MQSTADLLVFSIKLVDYDKISDFHHSLFRALQAITTAGWNDIDDKVDYMINFNLRLSHSYSLYDYSIKACMLAEKLNFSCIQGYATEDAPCWRWPYESIFFLRQLVHPRLVAKDGASGTLT